MLRFSPNTGITGFAKIVAPQVALGLHPDDGMYNGNDDHYLSCGASALNAVAAAVERAGNPPGRILDFGAGAGRVTRWLKAAWPKAAITVTDIRAGDLEFCRKAFGADSFASGIDVAALSAPGQYDLIWVGSVITHLSAATSEQLVRKLYSWLRPDGVLVMSFHGRFVAARAPHFGYYGITSGWDSLMQDYRREGFGYADYPGQHGYGISICSMAWVVGLLERLPEARTVLLSEMAWDGHHDVLAAQRRAVTQGLP
ncbi:class I SAM-dependent methyltransferase [Tabrizicola sp.]|uniref:class I SAM-dependent methyltransferase n=1 Tax=Tabrizicola sp. TaxID=2005166 RepID=UPI003F2AF3C8